MKKILSFAVALIFGSLAVHAQTVLYSEDFSGATTSAGPANTWLVPTDMTTRDVDGLTPYSGGTADLTWCVEAWVVRSSSLKLATSISWYTPAGTSDDWLITPAVSLADDAFLQWIALAQDPSFPDGYEVRWATDTMISSFLANDPLMVVAAEESEWTPHAVNLGEHGLGAGMNVHFAFRNNSNDKFVLYLDNIEVSTDPSIPGTDASIDVLTHYKYVTPGQNVTISGALYNKGGSTITEVKLGYSIDGTEMAEQTFTGLTLDPLVGLTEFSFTTPASLTAAGSYDLEVYVKEVNGTVGDDEASNDIYMDGLAAIASPPVKRPVINEFSGTWCGWCPDGALVLDQILDSDPDAIGVTIHYGDALEIPEGLDYNNAFASGWPSGAVDNFLFPGDSEVGQSRSSWSSMVSDRKGYASPVSMHIENMMYDAGTRTVTFDASAVFHSEAWGDLRMNVFITQDGITGYPQTNYYSGNTSFPTHPYFSEPDPDPDFVHNHTLMAALDGTWGATGIIPANPMQGDKYTKSYSYTLPGSADPSDFNIVAFVNEYNEDFSNYRQQLNAVEAKLSADGVGVEEEVSFGGFMGVYPNPFSDVTNAQFELKEATELTVSVYDMMGRQVAVLFDGNMSAGEHTVEWNGVGTDGSPAANGMYMITLESNGQQVVEKVMLRK